MGGARWGTGPRAPGSVFLGHKLRVARTFQGLGQAELAERLGVGPALLGRLEASSQVPGPELVGRLSAELGFAPLFFHTPLAGEPRDEECHAPGGQRRHALAHAALLADVVAWLDGRVVFPDENLPQDTDGSIEDTAARCRQLWHLAPDLPIPNLMRVVERAGVVVARARGADPSAHVGDRPLLVLDAEAADGGRLDLARLTGHVVLHRGADTDSASLAIEAEQFATALLLPRDGLLRELPRARSLDGAVLARLAERWKVSLLMLARRAAELPIANAARYREIAEHLAASAAARPASTTGDEAPEVLALALEELARGRRIGRLEVARRLGWSARIFAEVTGLEAGDNVISLAAWKATRGGTVAAPSGTTGAQLELDFGRER